MQLPQPLRREQKIHLHLRDDDGRETLCPEWVDATIAASGSRPASGPPPMRRSMLHEADASVWKFVDAAFARRHPTWIGFEDGRMLPDGPIAQSNAERVAAAIDRRAAAAVARTGPRA